MQGDTAIALQTNADSGGIRERGIAASVPHARNADAASQRSLGDAIEVGGFGAGFVPARAQRFETFANAHAFAKNLPGDSRSVVVERIENAELKTIHAELVGQIVIELLLRDRALGHAKATKCAGRDKMRMDGACERAIVRNEIRT